MTGQLAGRGKKESMPMPIHHGFRVAVSYTLDSHVNVDMVSLVPKDFYHTYIFA